MIRKTIALCALLFAGAVSAQTKISGLTALAAAPASGDLVAIVDVSDTTQAATGTTKKITASNLFLFRFPASSTDNAISRYDGTSGTLQDSGITVADVTGSSVTVATTAGNSLVVETTEPAANTGASVAGTTTALRAGDAVASTDTAGAAAGGDVTITAGAAARLTSGNANGGNIKLIPGEGIGTGTAGQVLLDKDGTVAKPSLAFDISGNTGYGFWYSSGEIKVSVNTVEMASFGSSGLVSTAVIGRSSAGGSLYGFKRQFFALSSSTTLSSWHYNRGTITNSSAAAAITSTLVSADEGYTHRFVDNNATYRWTIKPNTGDTILWPDGTVVTAATGSVVSTARYDTFDVEALDATTWLASNVRGTWTVTP